MRIEIDHSLKLSLPYQPAQALFHLLLTPGSGPTQNVEDWSVEVEGVDNAGRFADAFGNLVHLVNQSRPEGEIAIRAHGVVTTTDTNGVLGKPAGEPVPTLYRRVTALTRAPVTLYGKFRTGKDTRLDILHGLMARVGETLGLPEPAEDGVQSQMSADGAQVQRQGEAVDLPPPPDYAHLFIGGARALDIPARFVTGYLAPSAERQGGLHAWAEAYDDRLGWIGFDPRLQICPTEHYVRLAVGLDAETAVPLRTSPVGDMVQEAQVTLG
ncbi:transglutaminase family protein [Devosia chinhatensis]|uniref:transglutaminase family protein n=1 Tax=Devosia chinhatensis TaxID=429727 RepID=UPI000697AFE5|nr:transglutaminase family protein [Devosia chinhatensis]